MKKIMNRAYGFLFLGLIAGVFYREFTKLNGFMGQTRLKGIHPHILVLGVFFSLILAIAIKVFQIDFDCKFERLYNGYSLGLLFTAIMLLVRGITEVLELDLSRALDMSISGLGGIAHIILGVSFVMIVKKLRDSIE